MKYSQGNESRKKGSSKRVDAQTNPMSNEVRNECHYACIKMLLQNAKIIRDFA